MRISFYKNFRKTVLATLFIISFGCTEVIDIELNSADPKIVIEASFITLGNLVDKDNVVSIRISKTIDYFNPKEYPKVSNAIVELLDDKGIIKKLQEVTPGFYEIKGINANYGKEYTLNIEIANKVFKAKSLLLEPLKLDSITHKTNVVGGEKGDIIKYYFQDNIDREDYAQIKIYVNGKQILLNNLELYSDQYINGRYISSDGIQFLNDTTQVNGYRFIKGDRIDVELISFDKSTYSYLNVLNNLIDNNTENFNGGGIPDNPPTNLSNDALGFFGAYSISKKSIVIK